MRPRRYVAYTAAGDLIVRMLGAGTAAFLVSAAATMLLLRGWP